MIFELLTCFIAGGCYYGVRRGWFMGGCREVGYGKAGGWRVYNLYNS